MGGAVARVSLSRCERGSIEGNEGFLAFGRAAGKRGELGTGGNEEGNKEEGNKDKVWVCMEVESMEKMMSTVDKPEMIKLREEAGAKIETQTFVKLIE